MGAKGSCIRALLNYCQIPYENNMHSFEEWPKIKESLDGLEFGQAPLLDYKGLKMVQSGAILFCVAREFKLMGDNFEQEYQIISLFNAFEEIFPRAAAGIIAFTPEGQEKIPENRKLFL